MIASVNWLIHIISCLCMSKPAVLALEDQLAVLTLLYILSPSDLYNQPLFTAKIELLFSRTLLCKLHICTPLLNSLPLTTQLQPFLIVWPQYTPKQLS